MIFDKNFIVVRNFQDKYVGQILASTDIINLLSMDVITQFQPPALAYTGTTALIRIYDIQTAAYEVCLVEVG